MPIWIPLIKNLIGQNFNNPSTPSNLIPSSLITVLQTVGLPLPNLNINQNLTQVLWVTFEAHAVDENSIGAKTS